MILPKPLNRYIEHTNLSPTASRDEIRRLVDEAVLHKFRGICVAGTHAGYCVRYLREKGITCIEVCAVVGFPHGNMSTSAKADEAARYVAEGVNQIDMVANIGAALDDDWDFYEQDIRAVREVVPEGVIFKVIIECCYLLGDTRKREACRRLVKAGADYGKTSTGYGNPTNGVPKGATIHDVKLMVDAIQAARQEFNVNKPVKVKAAGGVKTDQDASAMIEAGADCIGTSSGVAIMASHAS